VAPSIRKKLALTSPTIGGRSVDIVRSLTHTTEFVIAEELQIRITHIEKWYVAMPGMTGGISLVT
jgi:hypothetical protein